MQRSATPAICGPFGSKSSSQSFTNPWLGSAPRTDSRRWTGAALALSQEPPDVAINDGSSLPRGELLWRGPLGGSFQAADVPFLVPGIGEDLGELREARLQVRQLRGIRCRLWAGAPRLRHGSVNPLRSHVRRIRQRENAFKGGSDSVPFTQRTSQIEALPQRRNDRCMVEGGIARRAKYEPLLNVGRHKHRGNTHAISVEIKGV